MTGALDGVKIRFSITSFCKEGLSLMTPRERAVAALTLKVPDFVPTFELEYQLEDEVFGKPFLREKDLEGKSEKEREKMLRENAQYMVKVYSALEYSTIPVHYLSRENIGKTARYIRELTGNHFMLTTHGDGTFSIPSGDKMLEFVYWLADKPEDAKRVAQEMADRAIEHNKRMIDEGFDSFILCADYCFNVGPFLSPAMFREFVTPYLYQIIKATREAGAYVIKHTDGNIMPILDQLVECEPHALHSIDPMAGVDIKVVKEMVGDKVALCGNVHCAALQTGTDEEVIASAEYCLTHGKPGGGYIYCTSNVPFKGMKPERYQLVLDVWKRMRDY
jgi:uroporphyrinogen decarboxylase